MNAFWDERNYRPNVNKVKASVFHHALPTGQR